MSEKAGHVEVAVSTHPILAVGGMLPSRFQELLLQFLLLFCELAKAMVYMMGSHVSLLNK